VRPLHPAPNLLQVASAGPRCGLAASYRSQLIVKQGSVTDSMFSTGMSPDKYATWGCISLELLVLSPALILILPCKALLTAVDVRLTTEAAGLPASGGSSGGCRGGVAGSNFGGCKRAALADTGWPNLHPLSPSSRRCHRYRLRYIGKGCTSTEKLFVPAHLGPGLAQSCAAPTAPCWPMACVTGGSPGRCDTSGFSEGADVGPEPACESSGGLNTPSSASTGIPAGTCCMLPSEIYVTPNESSGALVEHNAPSPAPAASVAQCCTYCAQGPTTMYSCCVTFGHRKTCTCCNC
jgi:hypothetical protein